MAQNEKFLVLWLCVVLFLHVCQHSIHYVSRSPADDPPPGATEPPCQKGEAVGYLSFLVFIIYRFSLLVCIVLYLLICIGSGVHLCLSFLLFVCIYRFVFISIVFVFISIVLYLHISVFLYLRISIGSFVYSYLQFPVFVYIAIVDLLNELFLFLFE